MLPVWHAGAPKTALPKAGRSTYPFQYNSIDKLSHTVCVGEEVDKGKSTNSGLNDVNVGAVKSGLESPTVGQGKRGRYRDVNPTAVTSET